MLSQKTSDFWKDLPLDLLKLISKRLTLIHDYISFRSVSTSWRSAATFDNFDHQFPRLPLLIYFVQETQQPKLVILLDLLTNTNNITNFPPHTDYPYLSCSGWILCLWKHSLNVELMHYKRRLKTHLPGLDTFPAGAGYQHKSHLPIIRKMALSRSTSDLVVMVIWGDAYQLALCKPGDQSWTIMDTWDAPFSDIIYHDRKLYALDSGLRVVECDIHGPNPTKIVRVFSFPDVPLACIRYCIGCVVHNYLVKSSWKFLIVCRYICRDRSYYFRIFEIELNDGSYVEINNLRGRYVFVGLNSSICAEYPVSSNVKLESNCIYFTNTVEQSRYPDTGVYRLCDRSVKISFPKWFCFPQPSVVEPVFNSMVYP